MSNRGLLAVVMLGAIAAACGPSDLSVSAPGDTSTTIGDAVAAAPAESVETYLVEMSNLAADHGDSISAYEEAHFEETVGAHPVEPGSEQPEPTEEELFEEQYEYWIGFFDLFLAHAEALDSIAPPPGFEATHDEYVDGFRSYFAYVQDQVAGFNSMDDLQSFVGQALMDPLADPQLEELFVTAAEACDALARMGAEAGYQTDLGCPGPPP